MLHRPALVWAITIRFISDLDYLCSSTRTATKLWMDLTYLCLVPDKSSHLCLHECFRNEITAFHASLSEFAFPVVNAPTNRCRCCFRCLMNCYATNCYSCRRILRNFLHNCRVCLRNRYCEWVQSSAVGGSL